MNNENTVELISVNKCKVGLGNARKVIPNTVSIDKAAVDAISDSLKTGAVVENEGGAKAPKGATQKEKDVADVIKGLGKLARNYANGKPTANGRAKTIDEQLYALVETIEAQVKDGKITSDHIDSLKKSSKLLSKAIRNIG